jgi:L-fuculose-phosphate aldolase
MLKIPSQVANEMIKACHKLYQRRLVANHDGNITFKISTQTEPAFYVATPTSFSKGDVSEDDLLILDETGTVIEGKHKVFSEIAFHMSIYRIRKDIQCVVHAHPALASGIALAGQEIGVPAIPEAIVSLGSPISTVKSMPANAIDLLELNRVLNYADAFLMTGNGAWTVGQSIMQTYYRMELVEHIAEQQLTALRLGGIKGLPTLLVEELLAKRPKATDAVAVFDRERERLREIVAAELKSLLDSEE